MEGGLEKVRPLRGALVESMKIIIFFDGNHWGERHGLELNAGEVGVPLRGRGVSWGGRGDVNAVVAFRA